MYYCAIAKWHLWVQIVLIIWVFSAKDVFNTNNINSKHPITELISMYLFWQFTVWWRSPPKTFEGREWRKAKCKTFLMQTWKANSTMFLHPLQLPVAHHSLLRSKEVLADCSNLAATKGFAGKAFKNISRTKKNSHTQKEFPFSFKTKLLGVWKALGQLRLVWMFWKTT